LIMDYIPPLLELLRRTSETDEIILEEPAKKGKSKTISTARLTFLVREPNAPNLTVNQFAEILEAIQSLYNIILKVNELENSELVVGSLDSGSDKSIDIIGVASGIAKLSDLLLQSWDRVRFARSAKTAASIKTASDGLTLLTQVNTAAEKGAITAEEAEKLRRTVIKSIDDLFHNGVYTRTMEESRPIQPSQLPVERRKLITHFSGDHPKTVTTEESDSIPEDEAEQ